MEGEGQPAPFLFPPPLFNADSEVDDEMPYEKIVSHQIDETIWKTGAREDGGCRLAQDSKGIHPLASFRMRSKTNVPSCAAHSTSS